MINLKGIVTVVRRDSSTNEILEEITEENLIPNDVFQKSPALGQVSDNVAEGVQTYRDCSIIISTDEKVPSRLRNYLDNVIGTGFIDTGVTSPIYQSITPPIYMQIQNRIGFVGITRTITTIALTTQLSSTLATSADNNNYTPVRNNVDVVAYLKLSVGCIQGPTDILDVFYRIVLDESNYTGLYKLSTRAAQNITQQYIGARAGIPPISRVGATCFGYLVATPSAIPNQSVHPYIEFGTSDNNSLLGSYGGFIGNFGQGNSAVNFSSTKTIPSIGASSVTGTEIEQRYSLFKKIITGTVSTNTTLVGREISAPGANNSANVRIGTILKGLLYGKANNLSAVASFPTLELTPNIHAAYWGENIDLANQSIFQSVYTHSTDALFPFQDVNRLGFGSGIYTLSETPEWTEKIPKLLRVDIGATGAVGVATYKFSIRNYLGFDGNSWSYERAVVCPFTLASTPAIYTNRGAVSTAANPIPFLRCHGNNSSRATRFNKTTIVQWDDTGITLLDVMTGEYQNWDATTSPALAVTACKQVEVDPTTNSIYVGCRNTGLYRVIPAGFPSAGVTQLSADPCTGVDVGHNSRIFATFSGANGRLSSSVNYATPLTFASTDITTGAGASWSNVQYLKANLENVNYRVGIVVNNADLGRIVWYQDSDGATSSLTIASVSTITAAFNTNYSNSFDVGDKLSLWVLIITSGSVRAKFLAWGDTTIDINTSLSFNITPGESAQFTEQGYYIGSSWVCLGDSGNVFNQGNTANIVSNMASFAHTDFAYTRLLNSTFGNISGSNGDSLIKSNRFVYLSKGVAHFGTYNAVIFPNFIFSNPGGAVNTGTGATIPNPLIWDDYEWNGSNWVQRLYTFSGGTWTRQAAIGFKTTASGALPLIDGLSIAFANGAVAPSYNGTDYYTQVICQGIHHDMSNTVSVNSGLYTRPLIRNQAFSATIPSVSPYQIIVPKSTFGTLPDAAFSSLENHAPEELFTVSITGNSPSNVVTYYKLPQLQIPIGPNEVAIDPKGVLMFSAADAGKVVSGTYAYIQAGETYPAVNQVFGVSGLAFGYDNTTIVQSGGLLTSWDDITSNNFDATPPTAGNQPSVISAALNGLPVVSFNNASFDKYLQIASSESVANGSLIEDLTKGFTFVAVVNYNGIGHGGSSIEKALLSLNENAGITPLSGDSIIYSRGLSFGLSNNNTQTASYTNSYERNDSIRLTRNGNTFANNIWSTMIITVFPDNNGQIRINENITNFGIENIGIFNKLRMERRRFNYINYFPSTPVLTLNASRVTRASIAALYFFNVGLNGYECSKIAQDLKTKYALTAY